MSSFRVVLLVAMLLNLTACGFHALYGQGGAGVASAPNQLALVRIDRIPDRLGQELRNALLDRITPMGPPSEPRYFLHVSIKETLQELGIRKDETATRANLRLNADYVLYDAITRAELFKAKLRAVGSYNILESDFATLAAEQNVRSRLIRKISDSIRTGVAVHLSSQPNAP